MSTEVADVLANRSSEVKKALLLELLREQMRQHPRQPIPIMDEGGVPVGMFAPLSMKLTDTVAIMDEGGVPVGMFAPLSMKLTDTVFVEGTPSFFAELERRRQENDRIPADEFLRRLRAGKPTS